MQGHLASCFTPLVNNASWVFIRWCFPLDSTQTRVNVFICPGYVSALALHSLILCTADCTVKWGDFSDYKKGYLGLSAPWKALMIFWDAAWPWELIKTTLYSHVLMGHLQYESQHHAPKATVQQSLLVSPSLGSMFTTGVSFCLESHTLTVPVNKTTHMWLSLSDENKPNVNWAGGWLLLAEINLLYFHIYWTDWTWTTTLLSLLSCSETTWTA